MFDTEIAAARTYVARCLGSFGTGHDLDHTLRVTANAGRLCDELPDADRLTVLLAAMLHDIGRPVEHCSGGRVCHAQVGSVLAREYLRSRSAISSTRREAVVSAVARHRYRMISMRPETLEEKILFDADKLDSLGAVGIGRAFLFAGACNSRLHNKASEALAGEAYGREDSAYREYLVKLRHLPEAMQTLPGKALARERLQYMTDFFRQLDLEIYGEIQSDGEVTE